MAQKNGNQVVEGIKACVVRSLLGPKVFKTVSGRTSIYGTHPQVAEQFPFQPSWLLQVSSNFHVSFARLKWVCRLVVEAVD